MCDQWTEEKRVRKVGEGRVLFITVFHTFTPESHVHRDTVVQAMATGLDELDSSSEQPAGLAPQISITTLSSGSVRARLQWVRPRGLPSLPAAMLPADAQSSAAVNEVAVSEALAKIKTRAPAAEVVAAWLKSLGPKLEEAAAAPHAARAALRVAIVDMCTTSTVIDEDRHSGWKYTGAILRAFDAALLVLAPARGLKGEERARCPPGSIRDWSSRRTAMAPPFVGQEPLDPALLSSWRSELRQASSAASRAHSWAGPHWIPLEGLGKTSLLHRTIGHVLLMASSIGATIAADSVGAEFWTQRVNPHAPCKLHWDVDEMLGQSEAPRVECPLLSAIVYLSDEGGPTMMIGRRPTDDLEEPNTAAWQERVWLVWPHCGQIAVFPGDMLHGVMPLPSTMPATQMPTLRQTVLINLWAKRPQGLPLMPPELAPCLAMNEADLRAAEAMAEAISAAGGESAPAAPGTMRQAPRAGCVRHKSWLDSESRTWNATEVRQGMFFGQFNWWMPLPSIVYRGHQMEEFVVPVWADAFKRG